mmetsp:Transcript_50322/g.161736  ORF Transcript_50322/g.161736 Transcript_50322/m.161736 type:complete len:313 (-) Transcript_50322:1189-2127(-)
MRCLAGNAAVARRHVDTANLVGLAQLPRKGVLAPSVSDDQDGGLRARGRRADAVAAGAAALEPQDEGAATDLRAAGCGVVAGEVPIAGELWHSHVKGIDCIEENADLRLATCGCHLLADLGRDLVGSEGLVDAPDVVDEITTCEGPRKLAAACAIDLSEDAFLAPLLQHGDCGLEGSKVAHLRHVDAVDVWVSDLRAAGEHQDALRAQAVQRPQDGILQSVTTNDGIVQRHQHILLGTHGAVVHIVGVHRQALARAVLLDEGPDLRILVHNFFGAHRHRSNSAQGLLDVEAGARALPLGSLHDLLDENSLAT